MKEELAAIDVSSIDELQRIKKEQDVVLERLDKMEKKKDSVSEEVFTRVQTDYKKRLDDLDAEADPLKEQARRQYAELTSVLERIDAAVATAKMDREELQLRHELGEFDDDAFAERMKKQEAEVAGHEKDLKAADAIRKRFLSAFHSEEELESAPAPPPPAPEPPPAEPPSAKPAQAEAAAQAPPEDVDDATVIGVPIPKDLDKTAQIPVQPKKENDRPDDGTMILQWPKLVVHGETGGTEEHAVVGTSTVIGSADGCNIVLAGKKVAARHAEIGLGPNGHIIKDLGAPVGTLVNGVEVTEHELADGDTIQIGEIKLTFTV
jgi:hypothetical protein